MPYTASRPKALMRLGDYSILEILLHQLTSAGVDRVTLCVSHLGQMIRDEFGDGRPLGLHIDYREDPKPLGTAGPLGLVDDWDSPALVLNGDLLTTMSFAELYAQHERTGATLTVATQKRDVGMEFGVLQTENGCVRGIWEKPQVTVEISLGVYVASPHIRAHVPDDEPMSMAEMIVQLVQRDELVMAHPVDAQWHDIGTPQGFGRAQAAFTSNIREYLPDTEDAAIDPAVRRRIDLVEAGDAPAVTRR